MENKKRLEALCGKAAGIATGAGALNLFTKKNADALSFTNETLSPYFKVSGNYSDTQADFSILLKSGYGPLYSGKSLDLFGFNFGGNITNLSPYWTYTSEANPDGSTDYFFDAFSSNGYITQLRPLNFSVLYSSENGIAVPEGIGSETLIQESLEMNALDRLNRESIGYISAPDSIANVPVVPEPISSVLFVTGLGVFAAKKYGNKIKEKFFPKKISFCD